MGAPVVEADRRHKRGGGFGLLKGVVQEISIWRLASAAASR
jgi:hypothetical protein